MFLRASVRCVRAACCRFAQASDPESGAREARESALRGRTQNTTPGSQLFDALQVFNLGGTHEMLLLNCPPPPSPPKCRDSFGNSSAGLDALLERLGGLEAKARRAECLRCNHLIQGPLLVSGKVGRGNCWFSPLDFLDCAILRMIPHHIRIWVVAVVFWPFLFWSFLVARKGRRTERKTKGMLHLYFREPF